MKGVQILTHSVKQVTGNLEGALRVSLLPFGLQVAASFLLVGQMESLSSGLQPSVGAGIGTVIALLVALFTSLWVAVAWHRYVLLREMPAGLVPQVLPDRMGAYFLASLGYGIILAGVALAIGLVVSLVFVGLPGAEPSMGTVLVMTLAVQLPLVVIGLRLATGLPGTAVGVDRAFMAGWQATRGQTGDLLMVAGIAVLINLALGLAGSFLAVNLPILAIGWEIIVGWLVMMVGASLLTTLYGHYVQGRPLMG